MSESMSGAGLLLLAITLATFTEWAVERFFGSYVKGNKMVFIASAVGIVLCFGFNVDILSLAGFGGDYYSYVGKIVSGIVIGGGSGAIHKFIPSKTTK